MDDWTRHLECCICLEFAARPVRLLHLERDDCGVLLCGPCYDVWRPRAARRAANACCPRCRADLLDLGRPLHDPVLARIVAEQGLAPPEPPAPPLLVVVAKPIVMPPSPPPPAAAAAPWAAAAPVPLEGVRAVLCALVVRLGIDAWAGAAEPWLAARPWWPAALVASTTLIADDREAAALPADLLCPGAGGGGILLDALDAHLGWSRRCRAAPGGLRRCLAACARALDGHAAPPHLPCPWAAADLDGAGGVLRDPAALPYCRALVAAVAAVVRWDGATGADGAPLPPVAAAGGRALRDVLGSHLRAA